MGGCALLCLIPFLFYSCRVFDLILVAVFSVYTLQRKYLCYQIMSTCVSIVTTEVSY